MENQRNLILAIAVSIAILLGSQFVIERFFPPPPAQPQATAEQEANVGTPPPPGTEPGESAAPAASAPRLVDRSEAIGETPRVRIDTPRVHGSVSLVGGRLDDVTLVDYHETVDPRSPEIVMFSPPGSRRSYYADFGWVAGGEGVAVPGIDTTWESGSETLTPDQPLVLTWDNGSGLVFTRTIAVDRDYMFTVTDSVRNTGESEATLYPYGLISRSGTPKTSGFFILHEGPLGVLNDTLEEHDYDDLQSDTISKESSGGWIGITDKYWLAALVPDQGARTQMRFTHDARDGRDRYQTDFRGEAVRVAAGSEASVTSRVFVGAKQTTLLDRYEEDLGIPRFSYAVDWGWFHFLTKPIFYALEWLYQHLGNFGLAILALTVAIKLLFFPLANKSYRAMSQMKKLQPEMMKLRERYGDDRQRMNQELMAIYKKEKINPAAGCLPILVQIPVFFALYKVLFVTIEMRHAPFYGWIQDLSAPDPSNVFELFGLLPWDAPSWLHFGAWPIIMGITMFVQQRLNPQPADPVQAKIFMFMPLIFTVMLAGFPAGLVIYWTWNNLLSIAQQWVIMTRAGDRPKRGEKKAKA